MDLNQPQECLIVSSLNNVNDLIVNKLMLNMYPARRQTIKISFHQQFHCLCYNEEAIIISRVRP